MGMAKIAIALVVGVLVSSLTLNAYLLYQKSENTEVVRVIDGDSFETKDNRRIRLLGLDAPEKDRCLYSQSREKLVSLILNKKVQLKDQVKDDYGRLLANVYVDDLLVNKYMLMDGLARFTYATSPQYSDLKLLSQKAKNLNLGVYSPLCRTTSLDDSCQIKANNNHGKKYYFTPNCNNYDQVIIDESYGDKWFCDEGKALEEGFVKASNCR